jgi:hypothetical protein
MPKKFNVPRELQESFSKLIDLIPASYRYEEQIQKDILLFLKIEGEEFVRDKIVQSIGIFKEKAEDKIVEVIEEK